MILAAAILFAWLLVIMFFVSLGCTCADGDRAEGIE